MMHVVFGFALSLRMAKAVGVGVDESVIFGNKDRPVRCCCFGGRMDEKWRRGLTMGCLLGIRLYICRTSLRLLRFSLFLDIYL
jgi:hypothetical protein